MIATVNNMRLCEAAGIKAVMLDSSNFETFSATSGDYWLVPDDQAITGADGEPCELVSVVPATYAEIVIE